MVETVSNRKKQGARENASREMLSFTKQVILAERLLQALPGRMHGEHTQHNRSNLLGLQPAKNRGDSEPAF
jgi:hypothetical protein